MRKFCANGDGMTSELFWLAKIFALAMLEA
jgi:hypothetical protein